MKSSVKSWPFSTQSWSFCLLKLISERFKHSVSIVYKDTAHAWKPVFVSQLPFSDPCTFIQISLLTLCWLLWWLFVCVCVCTVCLSLSANLYIRTGTALVLRLMEPSSSYWLCSFTWVCFHLLLFWFHTCWEKHCRDLGVCLCVGLHEGVLYICNTAVVPFRQKQDSADILLKQKAILLWLMHSRCFKTENNLEEDCLLVWACDDEEEIQFTVSSFIHSIFDPTKETAGMILMIHICATIYTES